MRGILRVIVVMVFVSLAAYGLRVLTHRDAKPAKPQTTLLAPHVSAAEVAPVAGTAQTGTAHGLIYPNAVARRALQLGYSVFDVHPDGSMMAVPLPPGSAWQTMVSIDPTGHGRLVLAPLRKECNFPVMVGLYRTDHGAELWHVELSPHGTSANRVIDLAAIGAKDPLLVTFKMADGAKNNWSCNVNLSWDDGVDAPA